MVARLGTLLFAFVLTACSGAPKKSPDGGRGQDALSDAGCFVAGYADPPYACALPEPCAQVAYFDPSESGPGMSGPPTIDATAARCVLQSLRDDVKSSLTVHQNLIDGFRDEFIWVQGDGTAILRRHYRYDLFDAPKLPRRFPRKDEAFFDACLLETDAKAIYTCLTGWWAGDGSCFADTTLPCNPGQELFQSTHAQRPRSCGAVLLSGRPPTRKPDAPLTPASHPAGSRARARALGAGRGCRR